MRGPCDCGAADCIRCYPSHFENGVYRFSSCQECGQDFEQDDEEVICQDCIEKMNEEKE